MGYELNEMNLLFFTFCLSHTWLFRNSTEGRAEFFLSCFPIAVPVFLCAALAFQLNLNLSILTPFHSTSFSLTAIPLLLLSSKVASQHFAELLCYILAWLNDFHLWVREVSKDSPVIQEVPLPWKKKCICFHASCTLTQDIVQHVFWVNPGFPSVLIFRQ